MQISSNVIYGYFKPIKSQSKALDDAPINASINAPIAAPTKSIKLMLDAAENGKKALQTLSSNVTKSADIKKAHAKARLEELKKELELLKKLYASDPKKLAKAMAHLTRELKAIVKEYASAKSDDGNSESVNFEAAPDANIDKSVPIENTENIANQETNSESVSTIDAEKTSENDAKNTNDLGKETQNNTIEFDKTVPNAVEKYAKSLLTNEDDDFIKTVKKIKNEIKNVFDLAKLKLSAKPNKENDEIFKEFKEATKDLDKELENLEKLSNNYDATSNDISANDTISSDISSSEVGQIISIKV